MLPCYTGVLNGGLVPGSSNVDDAIGQCAMINKAHLSNSGSGSGSGSGIPIAWLSATLTQPTTLPTDPDGMHSLGFPVEAQVSGGNITDIPVYTPVSSSNQLNIWTLTPGTWKISSLINLVDSTQFNSVSLNVWWHSPNGPNGGGRGGTFIGGNCVAVQYVEITKPYPDAIINLVIINNGSSNVTFNSAYLTMEKMT